MYRREVAVTLGGVLTAAVVALSVGFVSGCGEDGAPGAPGIPTIANTASALVAAADWAGAVTVTVTLVEEGGGEYKFIPSNLVFEAGKPVILTVKNPLGNTEKHYYSAPEFFKSVAWRKAQTVDAEYKAPYFKAVELLVPTSADKSIDLYFIPVEPGVYPVECTIPGHAPGGMIGAITVFGSYSNVVDQEVSATWDSNLETDVRTSGGNTVWVKPAASTLGTTDVDGTAAALATAWNISTDPRQTGITASSVSDKVILTADVVATPFSVVSSVTAAGTGTIGAFTTTTLAVHVDDGGAVAQISEVQITAYAATTTYTLTVDATVIDMVELTPTTPGSYRFVPEDITLTNGLGYILRITNVDPTNSAKHYYTAAEFYETCVTRKAQDSQAEIKAPYFKAVELIIGGTTELFLVPTVNSVSLPYDVVCTEGNHEANGMVGTIDVVP